MEAVEEDSAQQVSTGQSPTGQGPTKQVSTDRGPQEQKTVALGVVQGPALQQEPPRRPPVLQASRKKRGASDSENGSGFPSKRQKTGQEGVYGSPTVKSVGFRPANRTPPTAEDLELTKPVRKAKPGAEVEESIEAEEDVEFDPSSPKATMSKRVSELRGDGTKRSSRTRHLEKVARRSEYGLRSGLRKEWSMDS